MHDPMSPEVKRIGSGLTIKVAGQKVTITTIALFLMIGGVLLPTAKYAFDLREPTPAQLLVAVCMAMFSAVLFLWILDSTSILRFRSVWVGRSVYGAAIVSILGTSVAVYRDSFAESKYPYEGLWEMTLWQAIDSGETTSKHRVLLSYSSSAETYWGFSDAQPSPIVNATEPKELQWIEITDFNPVEKRIVVDLRVGSRTSSFRLDDLQIRPHAKYIASSPRHVEARGVPKILLTRAK
jgi:hypothetical protein